VAGSRRAIVWLVDGLQAATMAQIFHEGQSARDEIGMAFKETAEWSSMKRSHPGR